MTETTELSTGKVCSCQTSLKNDVEFHFQKLREQLLESDHHSIFLTVTKIRG